MYVPSHFEEKRTEVLAALMHANPLATLVTTSTEGLNANHIPMEYDPLPAPFGTLRGHVARANPVWQSCAATVDSLAIFQGPHGYISPSWYPSKLEAGKAVPTWNYAVVHAHGRLSFFEDQHRLREVVERLTNRHESIRPHPWRITDAPPDYIDQMLKAIVGFEMPIVRLIGKWKLSQNRSTPDRAGVVSGLGMKQGAHANTLENLIKETM